MTATAETGPGFTANTARLNVGCSRAKEVLVIVTDEDVMRPRVAERDINGGGAGDVDVLRQVYDGIREAALVATVGRLEDIL